VSANKHLEIRRRRMLASLAPMLSFAGTFAHPVATTILPFVLFLFLRNRGDAMPRDSALRTADFAFSMNLWLLILQFAVAALRHIPATARVVPEQANAAVAALVLVVFFAFLIVGFVQASRGREFRYPLSFRLAERIFAALEKRATGGGEAGEKR
jgi:uncharacterized Tic20 family protein